MVSRNARLVPKFLGINFQAQNFLGEISITGLRTSLPMIFKLFHEDHTTTKKRAGKMAFRIMMPFARSGLAFTSAAVALLLFGPLPARSAAPIPQLHGNCISDDTDALQALLNRKGYIFLDRPPGGCYLVSRTLVFYPGDFLYGASANNPNQGPGSGVVIKLAPNSNRTLLRTSTSYDPQGTGNEFMAIENIVFDGNGSQQTAEMQPGQALVDWRGTFIQTFLRHVVIINSFGPALFTGSTQLDNVWIMATTTSSYAFINNPGQTGLGALMMNQVYVEQTMRSNGAWINPYPSAIYDPSTYGHAILFNGLGTATINQLHCESAATCLDFGTVQALTIHGITGNRIGNPFSSDPTDQYLMRALNTVIRGFTFSAAYFDQSGSTLASSAFPNSRIFGLARGLQSNDIFETPAGRVTWPSYTYGETDQSYTGAPFIGERPVAANELFIQKIGNYSPSRLAFFGGEAPTTDYAFLEREGTHLKLGYSPGPLNVAEEVLFRVNWYGPNDPGNNVQLDEGRLQTGTADNTDLVGELTLTGGTSVGYNFVHSASTHPECTITPQFDIGAGNRFWITYYGSNAFQVNFAIPVNGTVSYSCIGRN